MRGNTLRSKLKNYKVCVYYFYAVMTIYLDTDVLLDFFFYSLLFFLGTFFCKNKKKTTIFHQLKIMLISSRILFGSYTLWKATWRLSLYYTLQLLVSQKPFCRLPRTPFTLLHECRHYRHRRVEKHRFPWSAPYQILHFHMDSPTWQLSHYTLWLIHQLHWTLTLHMFPGLEVLLPVSGPDE